MNTLVLSEKYSCMPFGFSESCCLFKGDVLVYWLIDPTKLAKVSLFMAVFSVFGESGVMVEDRFWSCKLSEDRVWLTIAAPTYSMWGIQMRAAEEREEDGGDTGQIWNLVSESGHRLPRVAQHVPHTKDGAEGVLLWMVSTVSDLSGRHGGREVSSEWDKTHD